MNNLLIKQESNAIRCEVCHQEVWLTNYINYAHLFICGWFALAAIIPIIIFFLIDPFRFRLYLYYDSSLARRLIVPYVFLPIVSTIFITFRNKRQIIATLDSKTSFSTMLKGAGIGLKSLFIFINLMPVFNMLNQPHQVNIEFVVLWGYVMLCGFILMGWAVALTGLLAGGLLYLTVHLPNKYFQLKQLLLIKKHW